MSVPGSIDAETARHWYQRWESQQQQYAGDREERFEAVLDVVAAVCVRPRVIVDLGSGPGSLATRAARRFPDATVVAVDHDPFLTSLGVSAHPELDFVSVSIGAVGWTGALERYAGRVDAIVSSTALHYPPPDVLAAIYRDCAGLLDQRAVLVNADQFYPGDEGWNSTLSGIDDVRRARNGSTPSEDWAQWWRAVDSEPAFADSLACRAATLPVHEGDNLLSCDDHIALMLRAGFAVAGTVWQHGRSAVVAGVPETGRSFR
ncbi:class I SAM-dependent methyltransferase [Rhodococcus sp. NPDC058521]|uniref:class I SAM-dependent methyltransferase n=1 Tax=Rhodococcus sp. NPDC058521 TaxID=3346536 RepID=UPI0036467C1F